MEILLARLHATLAVLESRVEVPARGGRSSGTSGTAVRS